MGVTPDCTGIRFPTQDSRKQRILRGTDNEKLCRVDKLSSAVDLEHLVYAERTGLQVRNEKRALLLGEDCY